MLWDWEQRYFKYIVFNYWDLKYLVWSLSGFIIFHKVEPNYLIFISIAGKINPNQMYGYECEIKQRKTYIVTNI